MSSHRRNPIPVPVLALAVLALATVLAGCGSAGGRASATPRDGKLRVTDARVDYPANPSVAAAYFTIRNGTAAADVLESVSTPIASASVHRSTTDDQGRSTMEPVAELRIPAGSTVAFESGDLHVMLQGVTASLEVGDEVPLTLRFRTAGKVEVRAEVVAPGSATEEDAHHDH